MVAHLVLNTALYATAHATMNPSCSLDLTRLSAAYEAREITPAMVVHDVLTRIDASRDTSRAWIHVMPRDALLARAAELERRRAQGERLPLYGVPFAVKDNIDVLGAPTTAACPAFSHIATENAHVVQRLEQAGALCMGKTNMDQFATGLVGTRTPYGACANPFDPHYISGGSSSGSAVAVALGHVSFALGTDTAGSGRVPAGFCNVVGLKPTRGAISTRGVLPACRSLDCVSIFALTVQDAWTVYEAAKGHDADDPYSRRDALRCPGATPRIRCGVPPAAQREFFGDGAAQCAFDRALTVLSSIGCDLVEVDYTPFSAAARLLYEGPWIAERLAAIEPFVASSADAMHPVVRDIIQGAHKFSAVECFEAQHRLHELKRQSENQLSGIDMLALPTAGTLYRIDQVDADPIKLNTNLGYYTNFVNLLDLAAISVPAAFREDALPFGITLVGPAFDDASLARWASRFHRAAGIQLGATGFPLPDTVDMPVGVPGKAITLAVVGAHLSGMPLNHQLTARGARLLEACATAPQYRLYALPDTTPPKPALARVPNGSGAGIEVELWSVPAETFGSFVAEVPPPLAIGTLTLADGREVKGFVCEDYALDGASDITHFGGWRHYVSARHAEAAHIQPEANP